MKKHILFLALFGFSSALWAQTPAQEQEKRVILYGGIAHLGNGTLLDHSVIIFEEGKITAVADARTVRLDTNGAEYHDITGKHVYPGFILPNTSLGLAEIDAVRATRDYNEVGSYTPNVRGIIAYNTESKITATVRTNGILMAQICPRGGVLPGRSSLVDLDGWNWEDAAYLMDEGQQLYWPSMVTWQWGEGWVTNEDYQTDIEELKAFFKKAKAYTQMKNPKQKDLRYEALRGIFSGKEALYIHANFASDIEQSVLFAKDLGVKRIVVVGGKEAHRVTDFLVKHEIPLILSRLHSLPYHEDDPVDLPYKLPKILYDAGVLFCLDYQGDMERMGSRNLPFLAGTARAYGIPEEEAVKLITSNPAKIFGISDLVGTLEPGKDASIVVSEGDALDMASNRIVLAFIRGKKLELTNHQMELYEKYKGKIEEGK